jgi:hypothetical protein
MICLFPFHILIYEEGAVKHLFCHTAPYTICYINIAN